MASWIEPLQSEQVPSESAGGDAVRSAPRIYWLTEEFYPPQIGGLELMVSRLSAGLAARGLAVDVITRQPGTPCAARERLGKVNIRRLAPGGQVKGTGWRALPLVIQFLARLAFLLIREAPRYDLLIVSGMKVIPLVAVPVARLLGKRCIVRVESTYEIVEPVSAQSLTGMGFLSGSSLQLLLGHLQRRILSRADRIIAPSMELERILLARRMPAAKIIRIPNAVDLQSYHPVGADEVIRLRAELGLPAHSTLMLFAARLSRAKGIDLLARAWPQLAARHPDLCLVVVGSGTGSFDDCEAEVNDLMRRSGLSPDQVRVVGASDRVHEFLQASDLYILPSDYEGFGVGIIEALATGIPVLVTPVGVAPQLIAHGENGYLFPPRNEEAMVAAIEAALAARSRWPEMGRLGRRAVLSMDLQAVVEQYVALGRVLHRGAGAPALAASVPVAEGAVAAAVSPSGTVSLPVPEDHSEQHWWRPEFLEFTRDAVIIWEMDGAGIVYWNRAAERLYGYAHEEALGKVTHALLNTRFAGGGGGTELEASLARYGLWVGQLQHTTRDGREVRVEARLTFMSQQSGKWLVLEVNRELPPHASAEADQAAAQMAMLRSRVSSMP
jgi:PAS domain S-box-containing protein